MDPTATLETVKTWPLEDQLDLVFRLWDQLLDSGWKPELTDDVKAELARRLAAHKADPSRAVTWEQILERVKKRR
jgi:putative addiction module component (TIGR02574 family)